MASTDLAVRIATILDNTGLKKADKGIEGLSKSAKKLAGALGIALSTKAVADFAKASVKAFIEDEAAAARLAKTVSNLGLSFANPQIARFIDDLSAASGVTDDQLRPAFQALITTTGSLTNSQKLLAQAVDISAGSGVDLATVAQDLANAYLGNTKGLKKYNLGLTQTELKTMSFTEVQKKLNDQFQGSNAAYLETYAGKMQMLQTAAGEAQETIGGALIQALIDFTGSVDAVDLGNKIKSWSEAIAQVIDDFTWGLKKLSFLTSDKAILSALNPASNYIKSGLMKIDAERAAAEWKKAYAGALGYDPANNSLTGYKLDEAAKKKAELDAAKRAKELAKTTAKNTAELKKQSALKKAGTMFDLEQIGIIAALKGNISEDERKRLNLQLAIITGNVDEATALTLELGKSQGLTTALARELASMGTANPFAAWSSYLDKLYLDFKSKDWSINTNGSTARGGSFAGLTPTVQDLVSGASTGTAGSTAGGDVYITVNGSVLSEQDLVSAVQNGLNYNSLAGKKSDIGRIAGMFG
jgi:hypothetical protein